MLNPENTAFPGIFFQKTIFAAKIPSCMTISYKWLSEYLPVPVDRQRLSMILTAIGLEVESMEQFESVKGGLKGLVVAEVVSCEKHPDADKLKVTKVFTGTGELLQVVCGASNVAAGQKVVLAPVGSVIYPINGEPISLRKATIRGVESEGMLCAEDEIGIGTDHNGIMVLDSDTDTGTAFSSLFPVYEDTIFEIGLTPNRMDAMSHLGVARDVCAYLSHHDGKEAKANLPYREAISTDDQSLQIAVSIEDADACKRYSGVSLTGITVRDSPYWLQEKLSAIGLKPINNIVDITNFILHETGQPLHAFDADKIKGRKIIVKKAKEGELFKTLDDKERKLTANDLMIYNEKDPMCIAGVYGGMDSGISNASVNIFLESACFAAGTIRKTSLQHGLRTDAASRFEKGTDISNTVNVLTRAALLIKEITGGNISSNIVDIYPNPAPKTEVCLTMDYLQKLSGKHYPVETVKHILAALGFEIIKAETDEICVAVPYSKPDISIPADIVEEIMRIDGLDNIVIPSAISISPATDTGKKKAALKEKMANYLTGQGFFEIFTNSITNSAFYNKQVNGTAVKMINSLSAELDVLRPQMLQGGLQVIAHNLNRKNSDLRFFEFGKTYAVNKEKGYTETNHLALYAVGNIYEPHWRMKPVKTDLYFIKAAVENILALAGITDPLVQLNDDEHLKNATEIRVSGVKLGHFGEVSEKTLRQFDIKQTVFYADICWDTISSPGKNLEVIYREVAKFPAVLRDLSLVVDKNLLYSEIEKVILSGKNEQLRSMQLFDVFESEKLGAGKKSMSVSFTFLDETKTLTDKEIDSMMNRIIAVSEKELNAEIRK